MSAAAPVWRGSAVTLPGGVVVLSRETAGLVQSLLRFYVDNLSGPNGLEAGTGLTPPMRELRDALAAATAASGHADSRNAGSSAGCVSRGTPVLVRADDLTRTDGLRATRADDLVDTAEVTRLLQVGPRHARRLVAGEAFGPPRRIGRSNLVSRAEVLAYRARHDQEESRDG